MSKAKALKKSLVKESEEVRDNVDVLLAEFTKNPQIDDFVWIENTSSSVISREYQLDYRKETNTSIVNIAQHDSNKESSGTAEECLPEYTENLKEITTEWEKVLPVDKQSSKAKAVKKLLVAGKEEVQDNVDALLAEFTKNPQIDDDFVWIENTSSSVISCECQLDYSKETDIVNIVQHDYNKESSGTAEECLPEYTENLKEITTEWEKVLPVDKQLSKAKAVKKSLVAEKEEVKDNADALLAEFTKSLQMDDDFVWIENTPPFAVISREYQLDYSKETNTSIVNIAQHDFNKESSGTAEECLPEYTENLKEITTEWEKVLPVDKQLSKAKAVKKSLVAEKEEVKDNVDALLAKFTKSLQMDDDFVWIENSPFAVISREYELDYSKETNTSIVNIAQHDFNKESSGTAEECLPEYTENLKEMPTEWEKDLSVDQQFWEQNRALTQRENCSRIKYPASQRLTVSEINKIALHKTVGRDPSYLKFNVSTTATLNAFIDKKIVKSYYNVLGKGNSSVVIHAHSTEIYDTHGMAVKVYKLSNDVKKNNAILKRARREHDHLLALSFCRVPHVFHRQKNVLILSIIGRDQEPYPSLSSLPSEYCKGVYQILVADIKQWYTVAEYGIVHGNLCTKNILYDSTVYPSCFGYETIPCRPYVIGWGHSVKGDHPRALMKLMRDCHFVTNFFSSRGVPVKSTTELFKEVTGLQEVSSKVLDAVNSRDLWRDGLLTNPNRP